MPKNKLDQYYSNSDVSEHCCSVLKKLFPNIAENTFLEPSAGEGSFIDAAEKTFGQVKMLAYDIDPKRADIEKADFIHRSSIIDCICNIITTYQCKIN